MNRTRRGFDPFGSHRLLAVVFLVCGAFGLHLTGCAVSSIAIRDDARTDAVASGGEPDSSQVDVRLLLVGDAGAPRGGSEPVLEALRLEAARLPAATTVVFLGDNVYPHGLPPETAGDHEAAVAALRMQIAAVAQSGAQGFFVPGNHDYASGGWAGLQREIQFIDREGAPRVRALPAGACPGPDIVDVGTTLRLVALDTQWWFQDPPKPQHPASSCRCDQESEIAAALRLALAEAGTRRVVVLTHHPLASHGQHGGFFPWQQHVFPLRALADWAWLPLPVVGSLYPMARNRGITEQDLSNARYRQMRTAFADAFRAHPPLVYASGHDHNLQLLETPGGTAQVVSGAGSISRPDPVGRGSDTIAVAAQAGFVRLDLLRNGGAWLQFVCVSPSGAVTRPFARWLARG